MAKTSWMARHRRRERLVEKYREKRRELKEKGDWEALQKLPRDSSPVRLNNRCPISGRTRGFMRAFGVSRLVFREKALQGEIPGVKKASW